MREIFFVCGFFVFLNASVIFFLIISSLILINNIDLTTNDTKLLNSYWTCREEATEAKTSPALNSPTYIPQYMLENHIIHRHSWTSQPVSFAQTVIQDKRVAVKMGILDFDIQKGDICQKCYTFWLKLHRPIFQLPRTEAVLIQHNFNPIVMITPSSSRITLAFL